MDILYLLIPIAVLLVGFAIWAFLWAVKSNQFEDLEGPAHRILFDDDDADDLTASQQKPQPENQDQSK